MDGLEEHTGADKQAVDHGGDNDGDDGGEDGFNINHRLPCLRYSSTGISWIGWVSFIRLMVGASMGWLGN